MSSEPSEDTQLVQQTDAALALRAQSGDQEAFAVLMQRHWDTASRLARRVVNDRDEVADILQEAALAAYLNLQTLSAADRFAGWFCGIVLNHCRMHRRRARLSPPMRSLETSTASSGFDVQTIVEERALLVKVTAAVQLLPEAQRRAAMLVYFEGLSLSEAAAALDISSSALKVRLHRARKTLRSQFRVLPSRAVSGRSKRRRLTMVEIEVFDVALSRHTTKEGKGGIPAVILLREKGGSRVLPVWVGEPEGTSIAMALEGFQTPRPLTYHFTASLLEAARVSVQSATIHKLVKDTFYATVAIRRGRTVAEIDARPSDAINLALRTNAPLFVEEQVLTKAGQRVRATKAGRTGSAALLERFEEQRRLVHSGASEEEPTQEEHAQQVRQALRDLGLEPLDDVDEAGR